MSKGLCNCGIGDACSDCIPDQIHFKKQGDSTRGGYLYVGEDKPCNRIGYIYKKASSLIATEIVKRYNNLAALREEE